MPTQLLDALTAAHQQLLPWCQARIRVAAQPDGSATAIGLLKDLDALASSVDRQTWSLRWSCAREDDPDAAWTLQVTQR